jgi:hypothetical protein
MYIIKTHYEATENNPNFAGETQDWYSGKGGKILADRDKFPYSYFIREDGYKTLAAARRGLKAAQELAESETAHGYWIVTAEIVEAFC